VETTRGWRLAKEKTSHKIDVVVALSFAAVAAVREGTQGKGARTRFYGPDGTGVATGSGDEAGPTPRHAGVPVPAHLVPDARYNPLVVGTPRR
jgi:hypothetical protein